MRKKWNKILTISILTLFLVQAKGQDFLKINVLETPQWNSGKEGETMRFQLLLDSTDVNVEHVAFAIVQGKQIGMQLDSSGLFVWKPPYEFVDRIEGKRTLQILIEAKSEVGTISKNIDLEVKHTNRSPIANDLKPFYIKYNTTNTYKIDNSFVYDPDNDPTVIIPSVEELPEGMHINSNGEIGWSPSFTQFRKLKSEPIYISFSVEDQPAKSHTNGKIKLVATQLDLPPVITVVPELEKTIRIKEKETINLRFYLSDPNGDDDVDTFDFLTNQKNFPSDKLIKNTANQYELIWTPDYDFVQDPNDSLAFYLDFFVMDKTQLRDEKRINFVVKNAINEAETDRKNYELYRGTLLRAWELMEQLKEKEEELKKTYNRAKKGKRQRSVVNASLGATTGLSSIIAKEKPDTQRLISTIGGTTVLTIGTLEATEVIGRSTKDLIERLNYIIEKKNDLQTKGDVFARDFSLKASRRSTEFVRKVDDFMAALNLKGLVALELDASWEPKVSSTDKAIKKTFKDFNDQ